MDRGLCLENFSWHTFSNVNLHMATVYLGSRRLFDERQRLRLDRLRG